MSLDRIADKKPAETAKGLTVAGAMQTDKTNWEYIVIPEEDALGQAHPSIGLNGEHFEAGKTYLLPPSIASFVKERLKAYARATIRIMSPKRDTDAESKVAVGSANGRAFGNTIQAVDASHIQTL